MILAAAAVAAVTTVSAQSMKAEIPFPFQATGARMQPGTYWVTLSRTSGVQRVQIYNQDTRKSIIAVPRVANSPARPESANPVLSFACTEGRCVLSSIKDTAAVTYNFAAPKPGPGTHMATIALKADRAE
jgi:hypothetical protein